MRRPLSSLCDEREPQNGNPMRARQPLRDGTGDSIGADARREPLIRQTGIPMRHKERFPRRSPAGGGPRGRAARLAEPCRRSGRTRRAGPRRMRQPAIADGMDETAFADWSYPGRGLIRGEALAKFVREKTNKRDIEQMKIPLGIAATDLDSGEGVLFRRGDTGTAVRASSAVPAVFQPVKIGQREYVDGGLSAPIPVHHARQMGAEFVIRSTSRQFPRATR